MVELRAISGLITQTNKERDNKSVYATEAITKQLQGLNQELVKSNNLIERLLKESHNK